MVAVFLILLVAARDAAPQVNGPAYGELERAYSALRERSYETALGHFQRAAALEPARGDIRKNAGYTLLKIGETAAAREEFRAAMELDPSDGHIAREYAYLCHEMGRPAEARRVFDRLRRAGDVAAEQAFQNIDGPLAEGIARWSAVVAASGDNFSAHEEIAMLAEKRDDVMLAAVHYEKAWRLRPERRALLLALGRSWSATGRGDDAFAALLAASRGAEPHTAERARELLPSRYPFVYEFERALALDASNIPLRRELAYLHLEMNERGQAAAEFERLLERAPDDMMSAAQLGFLLLSNYDKERGMRWLDRALSSTDEELTSRIREALGIAQPFARRPGPAEKPVSAKELAQRSYDAGYLRDAMKYLRIAHEDDPVDFSVMLRLGWVNNILKNDQEAIRWFGLARLAPESTVADEARQAYRNLRPGLARFRTSAWMLPIYSSRWKNLFAYGQVKVDMRLGGLPVRPYISARIVGDTRGAVGFSNLVQPQYLSERAAILGVGLATQSWKGITLWAEAGQAFGFARATRSRMQADYRGGLSLSRSAGRNLRSTTPGWFFQTAVDAVFLNRFDNDLLFYAVNRYGYTLNGSVQFCWNTNLVADANRQYWANTLEYGPGMRFQLQSLLFSVDALTGRYTRMAGNPHAPTFTDVRAGVWYAFSH